MALRFRLRRAAALSSSILRGRSLFPAIVSVSAPPHSLPVSDLSTASSTSPQFRNATLRPYSLIQSLSFRASAPFFDRRSDGGEDKKFGPDDILFEGCDYNHWLITMDFPKDPAPTREEMIETYIQTLAKVVGSVEEAKKRMYALSTTTYHGFQAVMTEEMSEKFHGLPGVVFVLPDSYIDPVNKEYGGDKYENGVITPRPPPIQYGRQGRPRNQNRNDRPNYNRPPPQGNMSYGQQDFGQGDARNYPPPQGNNRPAQDGRGYGAYEGRDFVHPRERRDLGQGEQRNFGQVGGRYSYPGDQRDPMPSYQQDVNQAARSNFIPHEQRNFSQGLGGDNRFTGPSGYGDGKPKIDPGYAGDYRQGMGSGPSGGYMGERKQFGNSGYNGEYNQGPGHVSNYTQESPPAHGPTNSAPEGPTGPWQVQNRTTQQFLEPTSVNASDENHANDNEQVYV